MSAYARKAVGHAAECKRQAAIARLAEPVLEGLEQGDHQLTTEQFRAVAEYLFCGDEDAPKLSKALLSNEFSLTGFRFWCDPGLTYENTETVAACARRCSVPQRTLWDHVSAKGNLPALQVGREKRYLIAELDRVVAGIRRKG